MRTSRINMETFTMKTLKLSVFGLVLLLAGCSTTSVVYDDIYYSRRDSKATDNKSIASASEALQPSTSSNNLQYDYQNYYQDNVSANAQMQAEPVYSTTETVIEPDGTTYSTTETYYNSEYAMRMRRFGTGASSSFGYYDSFNTGCFGCYGNYFSMSYSPFGWGWGSGFGYGWPSYSYSPYWGYYDPFFYDPWYSWGGYWPSSYRWGYGGYWSGYRHGYYNGFWDGYYYGGGYVGRPTDTRPGILYGHRGTYGGGSTIASGSPRGGSSGNTVNAVGSARGSRTSEITENPAKTTSVSERGSTSNSRERQPGEAMQPVNRAERPTASERNAAQDAGVRERPVQSGQATRPSAQERIGEYRERYDRPSAQPRYERPKSYTSPSARQPKSSNEYVRPQAEPNRSNSGTNRESNAVRVEPNRPSPNNTTRQVNPSQAAPTRTMVRPQTTPAPARSSGTPSYSQPSRSSGSSSGGSSPSWNSGGSSSSGSSRSSGSSISPSSSGSSSSGSSSGGSSRGSSSSGSSSSGNRR